MLLGLQSSASSRRRDRAMNKTERAIERVRQELKGCCHDHFGIDDYAVLLAEHDRLKAALRNLLAVIHRDGGHYTEEHGLAKSIQEAYALWVELREKADELARLTTLRPMSDLKSYTEIPVLWFKSPNTRRWHHTSYGVGNATHWTPLPEPKEADK
jgi:hypothetical protein